MTFRGVLRDLVKQLGPRCHRERMGVLYLMAGRPDAAADLLAGLVERRPNDASIRRLLGVAHLNQDNFTAAVKQLEVALGLLRREAAAGPGLRDTLRIQCEGALLRLLLLPLHRRLGHVQAAQFLLEEGRAL